jgi:predicted  nucleic acid-binding Zn-ribbon protein
MEVVKQITKEQLETIRTQQTDLNTLLTNIGIVSAQKHSFLHQLKDVNETIESFKKEIESEYGPININLEDGSYTLLEIPFTEKK